MSNICVIDKGTSKERMKVTYEIKMLNGERKRKSKTFPPNTPKKVIEQFRREKDMKHANSIGVAVAKITIKEFFNEHFLPLYEDQYSPTTLDGYKKVMYVEETGLIDYFGDTPLDKITVAMAQSYITHLKKRGLQPKTIKNRLLLLSTIFERAKKLQMIDPTTLNPVSMCDFPKAKKEKIETYSPQELNELLTLAKKEDLVTTMIVYLAALAGLRRGEICGLKLEDIDVEGKTIHISRARVYTGEKKTYTVKAPKSESGNRTIYCPIQLLEVLKMGMTRYKKLQLSKGRRFKGEEFIICYEDGTPMSPNNISSRYSRFMKSNKDKIRYLSLHKLRHTYASISLMTTGDVKSVQESLGHSSAKMTLDVYGHAYKEGKIRQAKCLEEVISSKVM